MRTHVTTRMCLLLSIYTVKGNADFRFLRSPGEAFNCIFPKLPDGGAELLVAVMPEEVEIMKSIEGFGKYVEVQ
jgi:hypothetical protein